MSYQKNTLLALLAWPALLFAQSDYRISLSFAANFDHVDTAAKFIELWQYQPHLKLCSLTVHSETGSLRGWKNTLYERHQQPETTVFGIDELGEPDTSKPLPPDDHSTPSHPENATWRQDEGTGEILILHGQDACDYMEHENNVKQLQVLQRLYYNRTSHTMQTELF